jgi:hypothetical protein
MEDGHPITDVFIEERATVIRPAHNAKEATVEVSDLRRGPAEKHVIQGAAIAIAKALPLNPTFAAAPPRRVPWFRKPLRPLAAPGQGKSIAAKALERKTAASISGSTANNRGMVIRSRRPQGFAKCGTTLHCLPQFA